MNKFAFLTEKPWQRKAGWRANLVCRWAWTMTRMMTTMKMALMMVMMNNRLSQWEMRSL